MQTVLSKQFESQTNDVRYCSTRILLALTKRPEKTFGKKPDNTGEILVDFTKIPFFLYWGKRLCKYGKILILCAVAGQYFSRGCSYKMFFFAKSQN